MLITVADLTTKPVDVTRILFNRQNLDVFLQASWGLLKAWRYVWLILLVGAPVRFVIWYYAGRKYRGGQGIIAAAIVGNYYRITHPNGRSYITCDSMIRDRLRSGGIRFEDLCSGKIVVLQQYEQQRVSADIAREAMRRKGK